MDAGDKDSEYMKVALEEAGSAFREGEIPVGAVLVVADRIISRGRNLRETLNDPTGHAEIVVIRKAAEEMSSWRLTGSTLYVTKEPCVMCAGVIVNARISRLVYGCNDAKGGGVDSLYRILSDPRLNHQVEITSGVMAEECAELLKRFFRERR
jgi:tRNA(adenine34) deaminase